MTRPCPRDQVTLLPTNREAEVETLTDMETKTSARDHQNGLVGAHSHGSTYSALSSKVDSLNICFSYRELGVEWLLLRVLMTFSLIKSRCTVSCQKVNVHGGIVSSGWRDVDTCFVRGTGPTGNHLGRPRKNHILNARTGKI